MTFYDWPKMDMIPRADLAAWHQFESGVSDDGDLFDYSGNDRHLVAASNKPVLTEDIQNGQPAWYFNGTKNPLVWSGSLELQHIFVVASFDDEEFPAARGLMSGIATGNVISSEGSGDKLANTGASQYNLFGKTSAGRDAPVGGTVGVIEVVFDEGIELDGIQIGKKLGTSELHKGHFLENLSYASVLSEFARMKVYQYFASRYHLWQEG